MSQDSRKGLLIRVAKQLRYDLKLFCIEQEMTQNDAATQAIEEFLARAKGQELIPPPPPPSNINFAVLHEAYEQFKTMNCPPEIHKSRVKRNKWRIENPFPFDGTNWVPRYSPMLSNSGKTIRGWHIEYHGDDGRQVDNDPYRNLRSQRTGAGRSSIDWEVTRGIGLGEGTVEVSTLELHAIVNSHDAMLKALKDAEKFCGVIQLEVIRDLIANAEGR